MKRIILFGALLCFLTVAYSQNANPASKGGLSFKRLLIDYQSLNGGDFGAFRDYTDGVEFSYFRPITENIYINVPLKVGLGNKNDELVNNKLVGLDVQGLYYFLPEQKKFLPYALAGLGGVMENGDSVNFQIPLGVGFDIKLAPNAYFNWQSEFRLSTSENKNNFNHGIGFKYTFGGGQVTSEVEPEKEMPEIVDSDGDGIADELDVCPQMAGLAAFDGCPDTDNDGVKDADDDCPEYPGLKALNGCPDSDGDGVSDNEDECPNIVGPASNKGCPVSSDSDGDGVPDDQDECPTIKGLVNLGGCPDTDGDGISDIKDRCPNQAGLVRFNGCPDTDGDGLADPSDLCPNSAGPIENDGCPVIAKEDRDVLEFAMKAVQFEHSKATLRSESYSVLDQIVSIMRRYPDYRLEIGGHTDNTGGEGLNQRLSEDRARACYEYLNLQGIPARRMSYVGYGESKPIADNESYAGRSLNRRVEFNLMPSSR